TDATCTPRSPSWAQDEGGRTGSHVSRAWLSDAGLDDAPALLELRAAVAEKLTRDFGRGNWSSTGTIRGVALGIRKTRVYVVRRGRRIIGTLHLQTKKPWAIDTAYFTPCKRPLY